VGLRAIVRDRNTQHEAPKAENGDTSVIRGRRRTMSLNAKQPTIGIASIGHFIHFANGCRHADPTNRAPE
jgi:hypothetical protein